MTTTPFSSTAPHAALAVFDIGSNAVRLTVYQTDATGAHPIIAKAVELCELGRLDPVTHALYPPGVDRAIKTIDRFCQIVRNPTLNVTGVIAVATEAMRRASDGAAFITRLKHDFGLDVQILSEHDEGVYGARGVLAHNTHVKGVVADLGGGSLQLTRVQNGAPHTTHSMPLGTLRLQDHADEIDTYIETHLGTLPHDLEQTDRLYVIGGSWRSLAKLYQTRAGMDTREVEGLTLDVDKLRALVTWLHAKPLPEMTAILSEDYHLETRRAETMPSAGAMLMALVEYIGADHITVSSAGVRDGVLQACLNGALTPTPVPPAHKGAR